MILVDTELERRESEGRRVRVGLVGAGYIGRGIALQLLAPMPGLRLVAIANRTIESAARAFAEAGLDGVRRVTSTRALDDAIEGGAPAIAEDAMLLCRADGIDVIIEATGDIEFSTHVALEAIRCGKHLVLMSAELDATVGPIVKVRADRAGVVVTNTDGDEPGVAMNLVRFARTIGCRPVAAGNLKGMIDRYRTPETQQAFAKKYDLAPRLATAAADGTKLSMECTVLANATGFRVGRRGMYGPTCAHVKETVRMFPTEQLLAEGLVDYVVGAEPGTGAWVLGYNDHPVKRRYMDYFKMGEGPLYAFYTPYHLPHLQIATTVARAALFKDPTVAPRGAPVCEVLTVAKRDLKGGEVLDGVGGFSCYGTIDNVDVARREDALPMGLSEGCRLRRDVAKDQLVRRGDVEIPGGRLCDTLRLEQDQYFA